MALSALCLLIASFWSFLLKRISMMQVVILSLVFGVVLVFAASSLYESFLFFRERRHQSGTPTQAPNRSVQLKGGSSYVP